MFAANFSECMRQLSVKKNRKTTDMIYCHQPQLIASRGFADITCFARFDNDECEALDGSRCLYPLSVIEFTKNATRPICQQINSQASLSANGNFSLMKYEEHNYWVPLLGMIMSEDIIQFRMYHLTIVNHTWKIAEIVLIEFPFNLRNMITSICAIHYYNDFGRSFLKQQPRHLRVPKSLFPSPQQNVYIDTIDKIVYKAYDYRSISDKANIRLAERRSPSGYAKYSKLKNVETFIQ